MEFIIGMITGAFLFFAGMYVRGNEDVYAKISGILPNFQSGPSEADIRKQLLEELKNEKEAEEEKVED